MVSQAHRSREGAWSRLAAASLAFVALAGMVLAASASAPAAPAKPPPNVIVVMTDDQTQAAAELMPNTQALIADAGVSFANSFISFPLCCPSRATFLTGQYPHNNHVLENFPPRGGFQSLKARETLPVWLDRAGYRTSQIGKFMNGYDTSGVGVPPGWDEWHGVKTENRYYGYTLFENGGLVTYGNPSENFTDPADPATYSTDVYTAKAVDFIQRSAPLADPFFLWLSYIAPHAGQPDAAVASNHPCFGNAKPAERHLNAFANQPLPQSPSFNEADVLDKPSSVRKLAPLSGGVIAEIEAIYRCELASLLSVDEGVKRVIDTLAASGELGNTYIFFTSDNGFFHGEHRIVYGKHRFYEESIRVPLLVRGPGLPAGRELEELVANVDIAPTIVELAGAKARIPQDGRSLLPIVDRPARELGREILLDTNIYQAIRNARYVYAEHTKRADAGERELYDLQRDPYQLQSLHKDPEYDQLQEALDDRLEALSACEGAECLRRPQLKLKRAGRDACLPRFVAVALDGEEAEDLTNVRFTLEGRPIRTDRAAPFRATLSLGRLERAGSRVGAEATLFDGRRTTLKRRIHCR